VKFCISEGGGAYERSVPESQLTNDPEKNKGSNKMKKLIFLLSTLALILALVPAGMTQAKKPAPKLDCTIDYWWVRLDPPKPFPGRWEATISGDIEGYAVYPGGAMRFAGQTSHYGGTFEIYDKDPKDPNPPAAVLLMAGEGHGSTTVRHGKNSNWRTSGTVTYAGPGFEDWMDRQVYQAGTFTWDEDEPGVPEAGSGTFRVN